MYVCMCVYVCMYVCVCMFVCVVSQLHLDINHEGRDLCGFVHVKFNQH